MFKYKLNRRGCGGLILVVAGLATVVPAAEPSNAATTDELNSPHVAARAQAAMSLVLILRDQGVRSDLKLSTDQSAAVDKALSDVDYPLWSARDAKDAETQVKCSRAYDHLEKELDSTLQPLQCRRLDGIVLQSHGWPAVLLPRFADRLKLSVDQQSRIRELLKPADTEKSDQQTPVIPDATQKQIRNVLTELQRTQLDQLIGAPLKTSKLRTRYCRAPEFEEISTWINSEPLDRTKLTGKVTAVHFWAFGCINCVHNLPHYQAWQERYADKGLVIVGFHTPETEAERVVESVRAKVAANEIKYPVAVDGAAKNWNAWSNRWWPTVYLVDKRGFVRYWWYGELNWQGAKGEEYLRQRIEELLAERD